MPPPMSAEVDAFRERLAAALGEEFSLAEELSPGGMGRVFVATEHALHRRVVVKVVADASRGVDVQRFRQEILLSASLQHPHIVPVHSAGDVGGAPYFVMPYVEGVSLRTLLDEHRQLRAGEAIRILRDIAAALRYAHARGVVHRDLKPANVMLSEGSVVVLDFGVAKALTGTARVSEGITGAGFAVGTIGYMAPEQVVSDPRLDHRADLYSFGVLAFEVCAGRTLFDGSPSEIMRHHLASTPPDLAELRIDLPAHLIAVVRACLQKDPADRPVDAAQILDMLDGVHPTLMGHRGHAQLARPRRVVDGLLTPSLWVPAAYACLAIPLVLYLLYLGEAERVRDGVVAAGIVGSLLGLPVALAAGVLLRVMASERGTRSTIRA